MPPLSLCLTLPTRARVLVHVVDASTEDPVADYDVVRVHPRSFHKFFHITHLDYESRKERVCEIAAGWIDDPSLQQRFANMYRKHDVADAILFCYHTFDKRKPQISPLPKEVVQDLEKFRLTERWFNKKKIRD